MCERKTRTALRFIGYRFDASEVLGQFSRGGELFEVAGIIDRSTKSVRVSPQFAQEIQNLTAAHELGHAILHQGTSLHRDRALDGSSAQGSRDYVEIETDKFATYFLTPERLVRERFEGMFCAAQFVLTEDTLFALNPSFALNVKAADLASRRGLARALAGAERYNGKYMKPLARQFRVSVEAMAIRLEELGLLMI